VAAPVALNDIGWKFYLVLICPSVVYVGIIYFFFPETKNRTLEEIGTLFGDDAHVASHWYDLGEDEKRKIAEEAMQLDEHGRLPEKPSAKDTHLVAAEREGADISEKSSQKYDDGERIEEAKKV